jgi:hypothetical protein
MSSTEQAPPTLEERLKIGQECLAAALAYAARGWSVLALCPANHLCLGKSHKSHMRTCKSPGKAPWYEWKRFMVAPASEDEIRRWWVEVPMANVGVVLGCVSGLVGIDIDNDDGEKKLQELSGGDLPATLEFTTGGGRRLLYAIPHDAELKSTHKSEGALSLLATGSLTVMPPSIHQSGRRYQWVGGHGHE